MKPKTEMLKRACWWVIPVQGLSVAFILVTRDNSKTSALLPLCLLLMLLNLPGWLLTVKLGLASPGGFNPPPDAYPVATDLVTFGVSTIFWVAVVWWVQTWANPRCLKEPEDWSKWR